MSVPGLPLPETTLLTINLGVACDRIFDQSCKHIHPEMALVREPDPPAAAHFPDLGCHCGYTGITDRYLRVGAPPVE